MKRYVVGFLLSEDFKRVVLIEKNRPIWQAGKLNGLGGHIEEGETPEQAMTREFEEEGSLRIESWRRVATTRGDGYELHIFAATANDRQLYKELRSRTDEAVSLLYVTHVVPEGMDTLHNLPWHLLMAISCLKYDLEPYEINHRPAEMR